MREDMPSEIRSLIARCEVNESSFTNDEMSLALHYAESLHQQKSNRCRLAGSLAMLPKAIQSAEQVLSILRTIDLAINTLSSVSIDDLDGLKKDIYAELFDFLENKSRGIAPTDSIQSQAKRLTEKVMQHVYFYTAEENQAKELACDIEMMEDQS